MKDLKYKTLAEVKAAFDRGELSSNNREPNYAYIVVDNDCCDMYAEDLQNSMSSPVHVFGTGGPDMMIGEALDLLGIPWESA